MGSRGDQLLFGLAALHLRLLQRLARLLGLPLGLGLLRLALKARGLLGLLSLPLFLSGFSFLLRPFHFFTFLLFF